MRPSRFLLLSVGAAAAAVLVAGCFISVADPGGRACSETEDCGDPFYDCVAPEPDAQRVCQLIYPPPAVVEDAGVDAGDGVVEDVFWCNDVEQLMTRYCAECHGEDWTASGNQALRLDVYADDHRDRRR